MALVNAAMIDDRPIASTWSREGEPALDERICHRVFVINYLDALVEKFKDEDNLTMVLGAGAGDQDPARLEGYTFLVSPHVSLDRLKIDDEGKLVQRKGPFLVPLDFNTSSFLTFLNKLKGKFKRIIFDYSVTKYVEWTVAELRVICSALRDDGEFYTYTGSRNDTYLNLGSQPIDRPISFGPLLIDGRLKTITISPGFDKKNDASGKLFIERFHINNLIHDYKVIGACSGIPETVEKTEVFRFPSEEYLNRYAQFLLRSAGFSPVEIRNNAEISYPLIHPALVKRSGQIRDFTYICAKKSFGAARASETQPVKVARKRPAASAATAPVDGKWVCPACTFLNKAEDNKCEMCETLNPALVQKKKQESADFALARSLQAAEDAKNKQVADDAAFARRMRDER